jgi:hypothetical protein
MAASSRLMIAESERRFPVRIRLSIPTGGLGERLNQMHEWLDQNAGAGGWAMTPSGSRGVVNDAVAVYFADATIAAGFVARWCAGHKAEAADGLFRVREDEPTPRVGGGSPQDAALKWSGPHLELDPKVRGIAPDGMICRLPIHGAGSW